MFCISLKQPQKYQFTRLLENSRYFYIHETNIYLLKSGQLYVVWVNTENRKC